MVRWCAVAACLLAMCAAAVAAEPPAGYAVRHSLALAPDRHGVAGTLELLQDDAGRRGTRLRVIDRSGLVLDERLFEPPDATLETLDLQGDGRPVFLLRVDYGAGIGARYGLVSFLMEVRAGRLRPLHALDESGSDRPFEDEKGAGAAVPIMLISGLRAGWVLIGDGPGRKAILAARSRPHLEDPRVREGYSGDNVILFHTYRFRDGRWHRWERRMLGDWEDGGEDSWPDRRLFP